MEAFFLQADGGGGDSRFCLHHPARGAAQGGVLYVHPFADEMNKARRMAALQSRSLSDAGWSVLQIDLRGCGDSSGNFEEASWDDWVADVLRGWHWLRKRVRGLVWVWGLRLGCLLAVAAARREAQMRHLMLWQAPASGKQQLQQFLRLRMASAMLDGQKGVVESLRRELDAGRTVEVAGYALAPGLAHGIEEATMAPPPGPGQMKWLEVSPDAQSGISPLGISTTAKWREAGWTVDAAGVGGPAFWQTSEIEVVPSLIDASALPVAMPR